MMQRKTTFKGGRRRRREKKKKGEEEEGGRRRRGKKKTPSHREEGQGREGLGRRKLVTQQYVHRKGAHRDKGGDGVQQETVEGLHSKRFPQRVQLCVSDLLNALPEWSLHTQHVVGVCNDCKLC